MLEKPTAIRLAKRLADVGLCSRREAERWIEAGRVRVNDAPVRTPAFTVTPLDRVEVDGKLINAHADAPRLWLYHKPRGLITSHGDPQDRPTVFDHLPKGLPRVVSVGRLDLDSEGLLLLTTSGALARQMELPANGYLRTYRVRAYRLPDEKTLMNLKRGITIEGVRYEGIDVALEKEEGDGRNRWLRMTLHEGKNREIRRVLQHLGAHVSRLVRLSYGPYGLGDLKAGHVKEVPPPV